MPIGLEEGRTADTAIEVTCMAKTVENKSERKLKGKILRLSLCLHCFLLHLMLQLATVGFTSNLKTYWLKRTSHFTVNSHCSVD